MMRLRARLVSGGRDDTRGAPCGLRPCRVRNLSECNIVGNDPWVVPVRVKDTFLLVQIYPPSSVAYGASFPSGGSLPLVLQTI